MQKGRSWLPTHLCVALKHSCRQVAGKLACSNRCTYKSAHNTSVCVSITTAKQSLLQRLFKGRGALQVVEGMYKCNLQKSSLWATPGQVTNQGILHPFLNFTFLLLCKPGRGLSNGVLPVSWPCNEACHGYYIARDCFHNTFI